MTKLLTQKEVAKMLHHTPQSISWLSKHKGLPVHYYSSTPRYIEREIIEWVEKQPNFKQDNVIGKK